MRLRSSIAGAVLLAALAGAGHAHAKGCIKGAIVGGIAGHAVHHGVIGAMGGCAVGHHLASKAEKEKKAHETETPPADTGTAAKPE